MELSKDGVILTERNEFVALGQAYSGRRNRLDEQEAIDIAMKKLELAETEDEPKRLITPPLYDESSTALAGVLGVYDRLKSREEGGSYADNPSYAYSRLNSLRNAASGLLDGVQTAMGLPPR